MLYFSLRQSDSSHRIKSGRKMKCFRLSYYTSLTLAACLLLAAGVAGESGNAVSDRNSGSHGDNHEDGRGLNEIVKNLLCRLHLNLYRWCPGHPHTTSPATASTVSATSASQTATATTPAATESTCTLPNPTPTQTNSCNYGTNGKQ